MMSRLSFRPRPLDIHKKLPIVKCVKDFEDDDTPSNTRNQIIRLAAEAADIEVQQTSGKKFVPEIPIPEYVVVDTYERDYSCTFAQPTSYIHARGARAEIGEFVEYDLDNEDEDWLQDVKRERKALPAEKFETILHKLEVLDHKARERAGVITPTLNSPIPVLLSFDAAVEALQSLTIKYGVFQSIYTYWKDKPPPPVSDTNPYNVFRPREKAHRLHTRRMQRRENNVQSFEKLRQVRRSLDQAKTILEALIKREEKKREVVESEVSLQRLQMKHKNEIELFEDTLALSGFPSFQSMFDSSEEEYVDSDDAAISRPCAQFDVSQNLTFIDSKPVMVSAGSMRRERVLQPQYVPPGWLYKLDPNEPLLLFTKPLDPEKLAAARITPPGSSMENSLTGRAFKSRGRIGRGGRIVFDRWNPLMHSPIECADALHVSLNSAHP